MCFAAFIPHAVSFLLLKHDFRRLLPLQHKHTDLPSIDSVSNQNIFSARPADVKVQSRTYIMSTTTSYITFFKGLSELLFFYTLKFNLSKTIPK